MSLPIEDVDEKTLREAREHATRIGQELALKINSLGKPMAGLVTILLAVRSLKNLLLQRGLDQR